MIRVPQLYIPKLILRHQNKTVSRLIVVHPRSVQYVQHDPDKSEVRIRYVSGDEMAIEDQNSKEMFDKLVYQIKDASD
jgi:hypothetical protein